MFNITPIPAFDDNYIWTLSTTGSLEVAVVDPGDADVVAAYLQDHNLNLAAILITHHHWDHTDGVESLVSSYDCPVYGPADSPFKGITRPLEDGDTLTLLGHNIRVYAVPGHTLDHISYYLASDTPQLLCGDTLFLAGCGRLFEGTPEQMHQAMSFFSTLPDNTEVYCTHEYSLANLAFAAAVEPGNSAITDSIKRCKDLRADNLPTVPTSIGTEKQINPFMRSTEASVRDAAEQHCGVVMNNATEVFAAIREWKNNF